MGELFFYLLSIAGPGTAATLLLTSSAFDWHLMFGGFGLAAVPLTIGTALLRHDTKLREQYREAARDVATLERCETAATAVATKLLETATSILGQKK